MKFIVCVYHRRLCAVVHCVLFVFGCQVRKIYKISRHLPACGFSSSDFGCQVRTYCIKLVGIYPRAVSVANFDTSYNKPATCSFTIVGAFDTRLAREDASASCYFLRHYRTFRSLLPY